MGMYLFTVPFYWDDTRVSVRFKRDSVNKENIGRYNLVEMYLFTLSRFIGMIHG